MDKIIPNLEATVPVDFKLSDYLKLVKETGIMIVESSVTLQEIESEIKIKVSRSVIDWLEMHDIEYINDIKYYRVGLLRYKIVE